MNKRKLKDLNEDAVYATLLFIATTLITYQIVNGIVSMSK